MNHEKHNMAIHVFMTVCFVLATSCSRENRLLNRALKAAGNNRHELEFVMDYYRNTDNDEQKLDAARFLISNMPAHYSYASEKMKEFNERSLAILENVTLGPEEQRDSIRFLYNTEYAGEADSLVSDINIMTAGYLISSIDHAFEQWRSGTCNDHVDYEQFKEWLLPYKGAELQPFDDWRGLLSLKYSDSISTFTLLELDSMGTYGAIDVIRNEIHTKNAPTVFWGGDNGPALLDSRCLAAMTYGTCHDYVTMGTLVFRSMGIPAAVDHVPMWGRNHEGHSWFVFLSDRGRTEPTVNSLIMPAGIGFYQYERIPKVWRSCYSINRRVLEYRKRAKYICPFDLCAKDVTAEYGRAYNIDVPLLKNVKIRDGYAYIAMAANMNRPSWKVLDFGKISGKKAHFENMGGQMLYIVLCYDGKELVPASSPFILGKDGKLTMVPSYDGHKVDNDGIVRLRRKYYESYNVVDMRNRLSGGTIECSNTPDFSEYRTVYGIGPVLTSVNINLDGNNVWRCWRYRAPAGSYGSVAEIEMFGAGGTQIFGGKLISSTLNGNDAAFKAFDNDLLSNFETDMPDGNWVGIDYGYPCKVENIRLYPRSDDNDIVPGLDYDLLAWNGNNWVMITAFRARKEYYDAHVPKGVLLWLRCRNRGRNERPFIVDENDDITWW